MMKKMREVEEVRSHDVGANVQCDVSPFVSRYF